MRPYVSQCSLHCPWGFDKNSNLLPFSGHKGSFGEGLGMVEAKGQWVGKESQERGSRSHYLKHFLIFNYS